MAYAKAIQRQRQDLSIEPILPTIGTAPHPMSPARAAKESVDLFYEGSKFFWRSRINVDFHFFLHQRHDTLEVIPFNVEQQEEMEHLYISYSSLTKKTNPLFEEKLETVRFEMSKDRFKKMPEEKVLRADVNKKTVNDFLLTTLGVDGDAAVPTITLIPSTVDAEQIEASHTPPVGLPVIVVRRRRKTAPGEFSRALSDLRSDSFGVAEACQRAQELTVLSHNVIGKFQKALESGSFDFGRGMSREDLGMPMKAGGAKPVSVAASRWKWAIRRVIRQIEVARVTERLRRREMRMSFPIDGNSNMALAKAKAHSLKGSPAKLDPIPDGAPVPEGALTSGSVKGIASGTAYTRSVSMQDRPSRSISYGDAKAKRSSRDQSPSTIAEHKPVTLTRIRRGSKGAGSDSDGEANAAATSTKSKKLPRGKSRDWAPRPVDSADAKAEGENAAPDADAKPKRRARATNVDLPPRTLAPMGAPPA